MLKIKKKKEKGEKKFHLLACNCSCNVANVFLQSSNTRAIVSPAAPFSLTLQSFPWNNKNVSSFILICWFFFWGGPCLMSVRMGYTKNRSAATIVALYVILNYIIQRSAVPSWRNGKQVEEEEPAYFNELFQTILSHGQTIGRAMIFQFHFHIFF